MTRTPPSLFVSYRSCDTPWAAALVARALADQFGSDAVFCDNRSILPGPRFDRQLLDAVRGARVLVPVIGPGWLSARDENGRRLVDRRGDWVRREVAEAFAHGVAVVPVLVGAVPRLAPESLPPSIRGLALCQFLRLRHRECEVDLQHLCDRLAGVVLGGGGGSMVG